MSFTSFIHSGHFYSASSSPLLLRSAADTARILCRSFTPKRHRQLRVKDLPKVPTLERDWKPRPSGRKASTLPMRHHDPHPMKNPTILCGQIITSHDRNNNFGNSILATHVEGFGDPLAGRDSQFEKPCLSR